jgi:hypothetical protein
VYFVKNYVFALLACTAMVLVAGTGTTTEPMHLGLENSFWHPGGGPHFHGA